VDKAALPLNRGCTTRQAIADGEDYELLFAISPKDARALLSRWQRKFPNVPLTRIGKLNSKFEIRNSKLAKGYVHFQKC
jgi:thiamine monophosphate kinase